MGEPPPARASDSRQGGVTREERMPARRLHPTVDSSARNRNAVKAGLQGVPSAGNIRVRKPLELQTCEQRG